MKRWSKNFLAWAKGFLEEGKPQSSRRLAGLLCISLGLAMSILDGFHFYDIDNELLYIIMGTGSLALGFSAISTKVL